MTHPLHFFVNTPASSFKTGSTIALSPEDSHHLKNVLRAALDTEISIATNEHGLGAKARVVNINADLVEIEIIELLNTKTEEPFVTTIMCGLCKPKTCEEIIEKAAELGVSNIVFFRASRSQYNDLQFKKLNDKLLRWQTIAEIACKQTKRFKLPKVEIYPNIVALKFNTPTKIVLSLQNDSQKIASLKHKKIEGPTTLAVGPEGDFTNTEYALLKQAGFEQLTLGDTIYRTESAAIHGIVALNIYNQLKPL